MPQVQASSVAWEELQRTWKYFTAVCLFYWRSPPWKQKRAQHCSRTWMKVASKTQLISCSRMILFWGLLKHAAMSEGKSTLINRGSLKYWKGNWQSFCSTVGWRPDCTMIWKYKQNKIKTRDLCVPLFLLTTKGAEVILKKWAWMRSKY